MSRKSNTKDKTEKTAHPIRKEIRGLIFLLVAIISFNRTVSQTDLNAEVRNLQEKLKEMKQETTERVNKIREETGKAMEKIGKALKKEE